MNKHEAIEFGESRLGLFGGKMEEFIKLSVEALKKQETCENVNHPKHYNIPGRKECIVEMQEKYGVEAVITFCQLNAYKYRYRHELKNGPEDLDKAKWYEDYAEVLKKEEE